MKRLLVWYLPTILEKIPILHQAAQKVGFSSNAATVVEIGADLGLGMASNLSFKPLQNLKALDLANPSKPLTLQYDLQRESVPYASFKPNSNFIGGLKLRTELAFKEAGLLDESGKLTAKALECVRDEKNFKVGGEKLVNQEVKDCLLKNGGKLSDWGKYSTEKVMLHTDRNAEIHFYYNQQTKDVVYDIDFKVKGGLGKKANDVSIWATAEGKGKPIKEPIVRSCPDYKD